MKLRIESTPRLVNSFSGTLMTKVKKSFDTPADAKGSLNRYRIFSEFQVLQVICPILGWNFLHQVQQIRRYLVHM